ncbi:MAG: hypothetical protein MK110_01260 [Fuerstiella sp.]|nr:hypothetical protein [Fuerstiella sp.]
MVRALQPYIVTSWHGHRDDPDIPEAVRRVWQQKFAAGHKTRPGKRLNVPSGGPQSQSNVDIVILDAEGNLVHWFDAARSAGRDERGGPGKRNRRGKKTRRDPQSLAKYTAAQLKLASGKLGLDTSHRHKLRPVTLPQLDGIPGIRILCTLEDDRMVAYSAPTVEVVPIKSAERSLLTWSDQKRTVDAGELHSWFSQVYPPGIMERTNPQTKEVYRIQSVEGTLTLAPAGHSSGYRLMVLTGTIGLTDEGEDHFRYDGRLEILLAYPEESTDFSAVKGVFEGIYPRWDRMHSRRRNIPLRAVFESIDTDL